MYEVSVVMLDVGYNFYVVWVLIKFFLLLEYKWVYCIVGMLNDKVVIEMLFELFVCVDIWYLVNVVLFRGVLVSEISDLLI